MDEEYLLMTELLGVQVLRRKIKSRPKRKRRGSSRADLSKGMDDDRDLDHRKKKESTTEEKEHSSQWCGCRNEFGVGSSELVVSTSALGRWFSIVSTTTLHDGRLVVPAPALSVIASTAFLRSSRGVVTASSHGHCECDGGGDDED